MKNDIGVIGLAVMGRSLALNMADHGYDVAVYNRSSSVTSHMLATWPHEHIHGYEDLENFIHSLQRPRKVILMVKAGHPVDAMLEQLLPLLEQGDIIMDGGNSFYEDTIRRHAYLKEKKISYFGVGISGGETGARFGPSMMPGGDQEAYGHIQPILERIAAKAKDGTPCCAYIGESGAGHYVKMVHNGIEYADMQLIAEAYLLLKYVGNLSQEELAQAFTQFQEGELNSYLIQITAEILKEKDDVSDAYLLDKIKDEAQQKGTGTWTSIEAFRLGVDVSLIHAAGCARTMSCYAYRKQGQQLFMQPNILATPNKDVFVEEVRQALYAGKMVAYAQGFALLKEAANAYGWRLSFHEIASIFRAGCIIQADFLNDIKVAFEKDENLPHLLFDSFFANRMKAYDHSLRQVLGQAIMNAIPVPALSSAVAYMDALSNPHVGANMIQAQRDYFGAHTYERTDRDGSFHHEWGKCL